MEKSVIKVEGMSCEHCVKAINGAVSALNGVKSISIDLKSGIVTAEYDLSQCSAEKIKNAIEEQGYDIDD